MISSSKFDGSLKAPNQSLRWIGAVWGALLLLTFVIPWGMYAEKPLWSWFFFYKHQLDELKPVMIGAWSTGAIVLAAGIWLRGWWLAIVHVLAGGATLTIYLVTTHASLAPWLAFVPVRLQHAWLQTLALIAPALFVIVTGVRIQGTANVVVRMFQCLASAAVAVILGMAGCDGIDTVKGLSTSSDLWTWLVLIVGIAVVSLSSLGCFLAFTNGLDFRTTNHRSITVPRRLVLTSLLILFVWGVVGPVIKTHQFLGNLGFLNNQILIAGSCFIMMEGLIWMFARLLNGPPITHGMNSEVYLQFSPSTRLSVRSGKVLSYIAAFSIGVAVLAGFRLKQVMEAPQASPMPIALPRKPDVVAGRIGDWPQFCGGTDRNMVSGEMWLPAQFDEVTSEKTSGLANVNWVAPLGNLHVLGGPVISGGKVFIGGATSSGSGESTGMLWAFRESDGKLLWRMQSQYIAWLYNRHTYGICSTPTIEGDRVYLLGHLGDVLCLDAKGLVDGNQGPFKDEAQYFATGRKRVKSEIAADGARILEFTSGVPMTLGPLDADIIWKFDMLREVNCWPFNALNAAIVVRGDYLYVATCSTLSGDGDEGSEVAIQEWKKAHNQTKYDSPSLIVLSKSTGKLLARDTEGIFDHTFHGAHSSPTMGVIDGKELLFYGGGNGTCYAFDPEFTAGADGKPGELKLVWKFDCLDPESYGANFRLERLRQAETIGTPVFYKNRIYVSLGNDLQHSGESAGPGRLVCIDATKTGDITHSGRIWSFDEMRSTSSTVAIADGLLYTADASGVIYCLDAETGKLYWTQHTAPIWSSPLVADGKVYVGTHTKGLLVFAHSKEKKLLSNTLGHADIVGSPAAANGVLYVATQKHLYALKLGKTGGLVVHGE